MGLFEPWDNSLGGPFPFHLAPALPAPDFTLEAVCALRYLCRMSTDGQCPFCQMGGDKLLKLEVEWLHLLDALVQGMSGGRVP